MGGEPLQRFRVAAVHSKHERLAGMGVVDAGRGGGGFGIGVDGMVAILGSGSGTGSVSEMLV